MRTDITIDRKQVRCPNASHLGFDKWVAQYGDIVVYREHTHPVGEPENLSKTHSRVARVIGRIAHDPEGKTTGWLVVIALSDSLTSTYERWIDPADVQQIYDPNCEYFQERIVPMLTFFFSPDFKHYKHQEHRQWAESGFPTMQKFENYLASTGRTLEMCTAAK